MKRTFRSKVDSWYYLLLIIIPITVLVPVIFAPSQTDQLVGIVIGLVASALPVWLLYSTIYEVDEKTLKIRSGPFRWKIQLADIRKVEPSRPLLSSPALSLDRLRIDYGTHRSILVSPADQDGFIHAINASD